MKKTADELKLMADYQCWPLWLSKEPFNINPATLPLSAETIQRLLKWAEDYNLTLNMDDPTASGFSSESDELAFDAEGISLWQQLRLELSTEYAILYRGLRVLIDVKGTRISREYK